MNLEEFIYSRIAEEASEIAQAAIKCQRFTPGHSHYKDSNFERMCKEMWDLEGLVRIGTNLGMFGQDTKTKEKHIEHRIEKELHYMQVSFDLGCIDSLAKMNPCHMCQHKFDKEDTWCEMHAIQQKSLCKEFKQKDE